MNPQQPKQEPQIKGEPLDAETLLALAEIDIQDIESAAEWWDNNASDEWRGALDSNPK